MIIVDYDNYKDILKNNGYAEHEFEVEGIDKSDIPESGGLYQPIEYVKVKRISNNKCKEYCMVNGLQGTSPWVLEFEKDLKAGFFA